MTRRRFFVVSGRSRRRFHTPIATSFFRPPAYNGCVGRAVSRKGGIALPVVYADVLFLVNFSADYFVLLTVGKIRRVRLRRGRLILGSLLGALYAVPALILIPTYPLLLLSVLLSGVALTLVGLGFSGWRRFLSRLLLLWLVSLLYGGAITALFSLTARLFGRIEVTGDVGAKVLIFLILFLLSSALVALSRRLSLCGAPREIGCRVTVGERTRDLTLMTDSGCLLREPMTGRAVILLSLRAASGLVPPALLSTEEGIEPTLSYDERKRYYLIPYQTVSGKRLMHGYRPDYAEIGTGRRRREEAIVVGVVRDPAGIPEGFDGIVSAEIAP